MMIIAPASLNSMKRDRRTQCNNDAVHDLETQQRFLLAKVLKIGPVIVKGTYFTTYQQ